MNFESNHQFWINLIKLIWLDSQQSALQFDWKIIKIGSILNELS